MPKVTPFLWFDKQAEEAANFYVSLFPGSKITATHRYPAESPAGNAVGAVMTVEFELDGVRYIALNGGKDFKLDEAFSLSISCADQAEVDHYWQALTADRGEEGPCGWCKDRFGLSWQVNPSRLGELLADPDPRRAKAAMEAMLKQHRIVIADIEAAADAVTEQGLA